MFRFTTGAVGLDRKGLWVYIGKINVFQRVVFALGLPQTIGQVLLGFVKDQPCLSVVGVRSIEA